ncbi:putative holin-like toxin [Effusibacillus consociatus]|uniref:Holin-like toxin n=1 Tax=Effusibacillus consociatus TaxID=1117041 RepID=A0ABV9Q6C9_9BACL
MSPVTVYEAISLMIAFGSLVALLLSDRKRK